MIDRSHRDRNSADGRSQLGIGRRERDRVLADVTIVRLVFEGSRGSIEPGNGAVGRCSRDGVSDRVVSRIRRRQRYRQRFVAWDRERLIGHHGRQIGRAVDREGAHERATRNAIVSTIKLVAGCIYQPT